jgi:succinate dehydrogenase / fumarate reductase flavoprotein subunit
MRMRTTPTATTRTWRKHTLAVVDGAKVDLDYRPVHLNPLIGHNEGGIDLDKIKPKARVY